MGRCGYDVFVHMIFIKYEVCFCMEFCSIPDPFRPISVDIYFFQNALVISLGDIIVDFFPKLFCPFFPFISATEVPDIHQFMSVIFCLYFLVHIDQLRHICVALRIFDVTLFIQILQRYMIFICINIQNGNRSLVCTYFDFWEF